MAKRKIDDVVPRVVDLFVPTVKALKLLGGSASIEEIDDKVAELLRVPDHIKSLLHNDGPRTKLQYRCAWARSWLKNANLAANSVRGVWALTSDGIKLSDKDYPSLPDVVRRANYALRRSQGQQAEIADAETDLGPSESDPELGWKDALLSAVSVMSPAAFERLAQRILREAGFTEAGFTKVEVTGKSGDGGIDGTGVLRVALLSFRVLFQCKRWKGSVGPDVVREFRGAMTGRADKGLIITSGTFSSEARKEATRSERSYQRWSTAN